ncbi:hypothetical protein JTB14_025013 [Gonioctena quinquepunctata]|nr:hypothetical protein JTB14_025013 [Gonioctena quinquepunctata]
MIMDESSRSYKILMKCNNFKGESLSGANSENPKKVVYENGLFTQKKKKNWFCNRALSPVRNADEEQKIRISQNILEQDENHHVVDLNLRPRRIVENIENINTVMHVQYSPPETEILQNFASFSSSSDPFADSGDSSYVPSHTEESSSPSTDSPPDFDIYILRYPFTTIIQIKTQVQKLIRIK